MFVIQSVETQFVSSTPPVKTDKKIRSRRLRDLLVSALNIIRKPLCLTEHTLSLVCTSSFPFCFLCRHDRWSFKAQGGLCSHDTSPSAWLLQHWSLCSAPDCFTSLFPHVKPHTELCTSAFSALRKMQAVDLLNEWISVPMKLLLLQEMAYVRGHQKGKYGILGGYFRLKRIRNYYCFLFLFSLVHSIALLSTE